VEHLKLPHYVDFQSELGLVRRLREAFAAQLSPSACESGNGERAAEAAQ